MSQMNPIKLPRFARELLRGSEFRNIRCQRCSVSICERHVVAAGVRRDGKDGNLYFSYEAVCGNCGRINTIIDSTQKFTQSTWWEELGQWHEQALREMGPFDRYPYHRDAVRLLVGPTPVKPLFVYVGFKGEVGPVILRHGGGLVRLERGNQIVKLDPNDYRQHMTRNGWNRFKRTAEGSSFTYEGQTFVRLTRSEMQEIVRDRVFTVMTAPPSVLVLQ